MLEEHFLRWNRGLEAVGTTLPCSLDELDQLITQLIEHNSKLLPDGAEQGICFFATPGSSKDPWELHARSEHNQPALGQTFFCIYTYPINARENQRRYCEGVSLMTTTISDVPVECWPRDIKVRSRLHYYLAQRNATENVGPSISAFPVLSDRMGFVSDSSIGSIAIWSKTEGLIVRPKADRYDSISLRFVVQLAETLGLAVIERYFTVEEMAHADELILVSTPWCIYPVKKLDKSQLPAVKENYPIFHRLMKTWELSVGRVILS